MEALGPVFGSTGEIYFRSYENGKGFLYELKLDSRQIRKFTQDEAVNSPAVSPDGQWIVSWVPIASGDATAIVKAYPKNGGNPFPICPSCFLKWSRDQKLLYLSFLAAEKTFVITLPSGQALPRLPESGIRNEADVRNLSVIRVIDLPMVFPGPGSVYAFSRSSVQRNLYRITLPQ